jgi:hypothetical protein
MPAKLVYPKINGFTQETPQGKNQPSQTAQEAALESPQETHVAGIIAAAFLILPFVINALRWPWHRLLMPGSRGGW